MFAAEDLFAVEAMQAGLESGANPTMPFGGQGLVALWFHEQLAGLCRE